MAAVLRELIDADTLVVASSDFTHYGQVLTMSLPQGRAREPPKLDMGAFEQIGRRMSKASFSTWRKPKPRSASEPNRRFCWRCFRPGRSPPLELRNLRHLMNDYSSSVSYLAIAFTGKWSRAAAAELPITLELSSDDRRQLVALARAASSTRSKTGVPLRRRR